MQYFFSYFYFIKYCNIINKDHTISSSFSQPNYQIYENNYNNNIINYNKNNNIKFQVFLSLIFIIYIY